MGHGTTTDTSLPPLIQQLASIISPTHSAGGCSQTKLKRITTRVFVFAWDHGLCTRSLD